MKARIKATGEIVEVTFLDRKTHTDEQVYMTCEGNLIEESQLDFNVEEIDYWTRLEHTYAGMAMQQLVHLVNVGYEYVYEETAIIAMNFAHALVEKYKKEERK